MAGPMDHTSDRPDYERDRLDFSWIRAVHRTRLVLTLCAALACFGALLGLLLGFPVLYTLTPDAPGTHPLSAICGLLLAVKFIKFRPYRRSDPLHQALSALALALSLARAAEAVILNGDPVSRLLLPLPLAGTGDIVMGLKTAVTVSVLAAAALVAGKAPVIGLLLASVGLFLPVVTALGYLYGVDRLHGAMSPVSAIIFLLLAIASLGLFSQKRILRVLVRGDILGRLARRQILVANVFFIVGGFVLVKAGILTDLGETAVFIAGTIWFVTGMVIVATYHHNASDMQRRQTERRLVTASMTDPLTGLDNRRSVQLTGQALFETAVNTGSELAALVIDLDRFKQVNDTFGHAVGDEVLRQAALVLSVRLRRSDVLARWGGEEFLVLLPGAGMQDATLVAEELRDLVAHAVTPPAGRGGPPVTASIGVAVVAESDHGLANLISRADRALYAAKERGRDCVVSCRDIALETHGILCGQTKGVCKTCPLHSPKGDGPADGPALEYFPRTSASVFPQADSS